MAYTNPWDNSTPNGAIELAADLDTIIQNLKLDITQRMDDLVGAGVWANNGIDPKPIKPGYAAIFVSPNATLPTVPNAAYPEKDGYEWWAPDSQVSRVRDSAAWKIVNAQKGAYNADAAAGSRFTVRDGAVTIGFLLSGTTDGFGNLIVDVAEIDASMAGWFIRSLTATVETIVAVTPLTGPAIVTVGLSGGSTAAIRFYDVGGNHIITTPVLAQCIMVVHP